MDHFTLINYKPFQTRAEIAGKTSKIYCRQFVPSLPLQPYIQCYWEMKSETKLEKPVLFRVIPDGCIDIIFDLNNSSCEKAASTVGTMTKPIFVELKHWINYIAVRFLPGGFLHFFNTPAYHFADKIIPLELIAGKQSCQSIEQLISPASTKDRIRILEVFLGRSLSINKNRDPVLHTTLYDVLKKMGNIKISELAKTMNKGSSQQTSNYDRDNVSMSVLIAAFICSGRKRQVFITTSISGNCPRISAKSL